MLFVVQFFTWVGMFALWVFTLPLVTALLARGAEPAGRTLPAAIRWVGVLFAFYVTLAAFVNLALPAFCARFGKLRTHGIALVLGSAGLLSMAKVYTPWQLLGAFGAVAIAWASISSTPYTLVTDRVTDGRYDRAMGVFNFSSVLPQVVVALCLGPITERLSPATAIAIGGGAMAIGGVVMIGLSMHDDR